MYKYETDYAGWAEEQSALLRAKLFDEIDLENIAHEIETIIGNERRQIMHRLMILIAHLLKWQYQPDHRGNSWRLTIDVQRDDIVDVLKSSPSLRPQMDQQILEAYPKARRLAANEAFLIEQDLPRVCPYTKDRILDSDFWPD